MEIPYNDNNIFWESANFWGKNRLLYAFFFVFISHNQIFNVIFIKYL